MANQSIEADIFEGDSDLAEFDRSWQSRSSTVTFAEAAAKAKQLAHELGISIYLLAPDEESKYAGHGNWTLSKESREDRQEFLAVHEAQKRLLRGPDLMATEWPEEHDWANDGFASGLRPTDDDSLMDGYLAHSGIDVEFDEFTSIELDH